MTWSRLSWILVLLPLPASASPFEAFDRAVARAEKLLERLDDPSPLESAADKPDFSSLIEMPPSTGLISTDVRAVALPEGLETFFGLVAWDSPALEFMLRSSIDPQLPEGFERIEIAVDDRLAISHLRQLFAATKRANIADVHLVGHKGEPLTDLGFSTLSLLSPALATEALPLAAIEVYRWYPVRTAPAAGDRRREHTYDSEGAALFVDGSGQWWVSTRDDPAPRRSTPEGLGITRDTRTVVRVVGADSAPVASLLAALVALEQNRNYARFDPEASAVQWAQPGSAADVPEGWHPGTY